MTDSLQDRTESDALVVRGGEVRTLTRTTRVRSLTVADGGSLTAPEGHHLTVTVDGVETGSKLLSTYATTTAVAPGTYRGDVVVTVTEDHPASVMDAPFHLRQAVYVDADGVVDAKSVPSAVRGGTYDGRSARGVTVTSTGEAFNGFYIAGGEYELTDATFDFDGNGRSDFSAQGAAVVAKGPTTRLTVDGATIRTRGAVRAGVVADDGARVVVKNSVITTTDGTLPDDYEDVLGPGMMTVPWPLGLSGNVRSVVTLGDLTRATYVACSVTSSNWGVLASDAVGSSTMLGNLDVPLRLSAVNVDAVITGKDGYGAYADVNAVDTFLGTRFTGVTYGLVLSGGSVALGDSTHAQVAQLDADLETGLSDEEIAALPERASVIESRRFGALLHQFPGSVLSVTGGTRISSAGTVFLNKGVKADITVDGSGGARLEAGNGVLFQFMDSDDPIINSGDFDDVRAVYAPPTGPARRDPEWDVTEVHDDDSVARFTDIDLRGDFYNGARAGRNIALTFTRTSLHGVISASVAEHRVAAIGPEQYRELGEVDNTAAPAVNNGVIVTLGTGASWTVTGTSHLTGLVLDADATLTAGTVTVDGVPTEPKPGTSYHGAIEITTA
ncbi:hypothetical protein ACFY6U_51755 [Streptomyces sp. NPDC013157]|uniref:hypothetical protein n=1 Tax=Streptomyces sp. NPDC013157 TaxID=3364861 RepID=UPI0036C70B68